MKDNQFEDEDLKNDSQIPENQENKINEEEKINEEVKQEEEKKEDKKEEEPKQEEPKPKENSEKEEEKQENKQEEDKKEEKRYNRREEERKRVVGKAVKVNFNLKGLLMLVFIITLFAVAPKIMEESKTQDYVDISYSDFIKNIESKKIGVVEEKDGYVYGYKANEVKYLDNKSNNSLKSKLGFDNKTGVQGLKARLITNRLGEDSNLISVINENGALIQSTEPPQPSLLLSIALSLLPYVIMIGLLVFMMNRMGKGSGSGGGPQIFNMGKSKAKENGENISDVTFADVAGIEEAKQELKEVVDFLKEPEKFKKIGAKIPKGVLLLGEPGTGKTLLAKAVAGEAKVPFFSMSGSEFVEMFVGVGASRVRDLFGKARKNAPCIVFIDEIDAVGRKRGSGQGGGNDEREQTLNQLLVEMDGFVIAKKTAGMAGADLANILNEGAILAARAGRTEITMADLEEASEKVQMGPERKSKVVPEDEKRVVAYHEVGHGIVGYIIGGGDRVHKITMIPRGPAGGYTLSLPEEEKSFHSKKYMLNRIARYFGGRAAEEIIFGKENITDGAGSDIYYATSIAKNIVTKYGMTEKFGPVFLEATEEDYMLQRKYYSEQTGKEVDDEIRKIITEQYSRAKNILLENRDKLEEVTRILLEKETIMGPEFEAIMKNEYI